MPPTLNEQVVDEVTALNFKNLAELHSLSAGVAGQNQIAQQQRVNDTANSVHANAMNAAQQIAQLAAQQALTMATNGQMLSQAMVGRVSRHVLDLSAEQTVGFMQEIQAGLSKDLASLSGQLASVQEMAKIANTTPPQTGTGGAFGSDAGNALLQQLSNIEALLRSQSNRNPTP